MTSSNSYLSHEIFEVIKKTRSIMTFDLILLFKRNVYVKRKKFWIDKYCKAVNRNVFMCGSPRFFYELQPFKVATINQKNNIGCIGKTRIIKKNTCCTLRRDFLKVPHLFVSVLAQESNSVRIHCSIKHNRAFINGYL